MNASFARRLDPRSSAVLVKEVRAALRGRLFRLTLVCTLALACVVAVLTLADTIDAQHTVDGRDFFLPVYVCLCVALFALVPFSAFTSMGAEWDEGTVELLVTSDLRPRHIVMGKLGSAALEALLYASAFAPFLAFTFLMQGVDAVGLLVVFQATVLTSISYAAIALWLSCLTKIRVARVLLLVVLAAGAVALVVAAVDLGNDLLRASLRGGRGWIEDGLAIDFTCLLFATFAIAFACQRLAHEEENRSSPARITTSAWLVVLLVWFCIAAAMGARIPVSDVLLGAISVLTVLHVFFATERETLPRGVRVQVPRSRLRALLALPFLPGGARALVLFALQLALLFAGGFAIEAIQGPGSGATRAWGWRHIDRNLVFALYGALYVVLGSLVASRWSSTWRGRLIARMTIPIAVIGSIVVPGFIGVVAGIKSWARLEHGANPFEMYERWDQLQFRAAILTVAGLLLLALLASIPRLVRAVREVLSASRARSTVV